MTKNKHPYPLGRHVQHDPRSRNFALPESDLSTLKSVRYKRYAPVFYQGSYSCCTGTACLGAIGTANVYNALVAASKLPPLNLTEALNIYSKATIIDEFPWTYPPDDFGSSGLAVAKVALNNGWISSYYHAFSLNAALTALQTNPVLTGVNWYNTFYYPTAAGECLLPPTAIVVGGHEIVVDEIDVENERVWFTNSWDTDWGVNGRAWFSFVVWERLLTERGDVTQLNPIEVATPEIPQGCLSRIFPFWFKN